MSHSKSHLPLRKDSEGKNLFTWKQFSSPFGGGGSSSSSAMGREMRHNNSFEYIVEESMPEHIQIVSEDALLKEANSNLMKKIVQRESECQELQERLVMATKKNNDILIDLKEMSMTNQRLQLQVLAVQEENDLLHSQLSLVRRRYASQSPSSQRMPCFPLWNPSEDLPNSSDVTDNLEQARSWEDLSKHMLQQMHLEIRKMEAEMDPMPSQEASHTAAPLAIQENETADFTTDASQNSFASDPVSQQSELETARSVIQLLKSQVEQLKTQLATQGTIMRNALGQVQKFCSLDPYLRVKTQALGLFSQGADHPASGSKFSRPSDELFRAYFTQQLHSSASTAALRTQETEAKTVMVSSSEESITRPFMNSSGGQDKVEPHEKVCPICQLILPSTIPQTEFESHVFDCLDRENSETTLEQFEVV